jgi:hypothetical protein
VRGKDAGRFVKDENARTGHEDLEDLNLLLLAQGKLAHIGVQIDSEVVAICDVLNPARHIAGAHECARVREEQRNVFQDCHRGDECEALEDHAHAKPPAAQRRVNEDGGAAKENLTGCGLVKAVERLHECAFARPVFAENSVDFATIDRQVDAIVGKQRAKAFGKLSCFENGCRHSHACTSQRATDQEKKTFAGLTIMSYTILYTIYVEYRPPRSRRLWTICTIDWPEGRAI